MMTDTPTILLVVDAQEGFRNSHTQGAIPALLAAIRASSGPVLFTSFINLAGSNFERLLNWPHMKNGVATEILREISAFVSPGMLFEKSGYSAFSSLPLSRRIKKLGVDTIDICGFDTDACVLATALDAFDAGYTPRILAGACASSGGGTLHVNAIEILKRNLGRYSIVNV